MSSISRYTPEDLHITFRYRLENLMDEDPSKNAAEISRIMFWIATYHPEILKDKSKHLQGLSVHYLYFPESWELADEFIPTLPLTILLRSEICRDLQTLTGYIDPMVLSNIPNPMYIKRLAIGKHTDVKLLMAELERRRRRDNHKYDEFFEGTAIHLRCGEINVKDLAPIPDIHPWLFISDVSDHGVDWVVQATAVLLPKLKTAIHDRITIYFGILHLPRSKLTLAGIEAIAKGFFYSGQHFDLLDVSTPCINLDNDSKNTFGLMVTKKYNLGVLTFGTEKEMQFTEIVDDICKQTKISCEDTRTLFDTPESDGVPLGSVLSPVPLGSVLSPVWIKEHIPADGSNIKVLGSDQRAIAESLFC